MYLGLLYYEDTCRVSVINRFFHFGCFSTIDNAAKHPHQSFHIVPCTLYGVELIKFYTLVIFFVSIMLPQITELFAPQKDAFEILNSSVL